MFAARRSPPRSPRQRPTVALAALAAACAPPAVLAGAPPFTGYLVEQYNALAGNPAAIQSGWDLDLSGGTLSSGSTFVLTDTSNTSGVTLRRRFRPQSAGQVTLEYRFNANKKVDGLTWQLLCGTQTVVNVCTSGGSLCYETASGSTAALQGYSAGAEVGVRVVADLASGRADYYVNGTRKAAAAPFRNPAGRLDQFLLSTGAAGTLALTQRSVQVYAGYLVNERFLAQEQGALPDGWVAAGGGGTASVVKDTDAAAYPDCNYARLSDTNRADSIALTTSFEPQSGKIDFDVSFLQPVKHDGFRAELLGADAVVARIMTDGGSLCYEGPDGARTVLWSGYRSNLWYFVHLAADLGAGRCDAWVNDIPRAAGLGLAASHAAQADALRFATSTDSTDVVWLDDLRVLVPRETPADYPPAPAPVPHAPYRVGALVCDLWREGTHYGWDWISSDPERSPLLGYYDEGDPEVADWSITYMADHGIDCFATCWYRPSTATGTSPLKDGNYHTQALNAYKRARYASHLQYTLIIETSSGPMKSLDDWKNNVVPFLVEHYFKDPRFLVIDNKPVVCFFGGIKNTGDTAAARACLEAACAEAGFAGATLIGCSTTGDTGFEYTYTYAKQFAADGVTNHISSPSVNWDRSAWDRPFQHKGAWRSAEEYRSQLLAQKASLTNKVGLAQTLWLLGNWNEYGEGHFLMPTEGLGFRYLDVLREVFGDGSAHTDARPTEAQRSRLNTLYPQPRITAQPAGQRAALGAAATFDVAAVGVPPLAYQWQRDGCDIPGATHASYTLAPALPEDLGASFRVTVSNALGPLASADAPLTLLEYDPACKMKITFGGYARPEVLTNFPALVRLSPGLATGFSYGQFASALGYDLRFRDADESRELNYEIESWNTGGVSAVWVQVPALASNSSVWASWGDPALARAAPPCATTGATWDATYRAVWHMKEGTGTRLRDATAHANDGTLYQGVAWTTGMVGSALLFNGTSTNYVSAGTGASLSLTNRFTLSAWLRPTSYHTNAYYGLRNGFLSRGPSSATTVNYALEAKTNTVVTFVKRTGTEGLQFYDFTVPDLTSNWTQVALGVADGTLSLFVNGAPCGSKPVGALASVAGTDTLYLGAVVTYRPEATFIGALDEVRIRNVPCSSNWVWACWLAAASNAAFASLGPVAGGVATADANDNGMPDLWERLYFGATNAPGGAAAEDWDRDGQSNRGEYVAGTCPTSAASALRIDNLALGADGRGLALRWTSAPGRRYEVLTSTNLAAGFDATASAHLPATPSQNTHTVDVDRAQNRFFRVRVEE